MRKLDIFALDEALYINRKKLKILTCLTTISIISGINMFNQIDKEEQLNIVNSIIETSKDKIIAENNDFLTKYQDKYIVVANFPSTVEKKYQIVDNQLVDSLGKPISLEDNKISTYFFDDKLSENLLKNMKLKDSKIHTLGFNGSAVGNYVINYLPSTLTSLSFKKCSFITNLDNLPNVCPNIEYLNLGLMPSLTNFDFIYKLPNLKELYITDSAYITTDLLNYLEQNEIKNNLGIFDVALNLKTNTIIEEIIKPNMSELDKVKAITKYVINNLRYDAESSEISNKYPLTESLMSRKGVCTSYAYLTNVLLNKANIDAYKLVNEDHAWNLVKIDNKYYYLDTTNINPGEFYQFLLDKLNFSKNYMIDTESTFNTSMTNPSDDKTIIPTELIDDIKDARNDKNLIEKYGSTIINSSYYIGSIIAGITLYLGIIPIIGTMVIGTNTVLSIKEDYEDEIRKILIKDMED